MALAPQLENMAEQEAVTVVLCTYNRAHILGGAIERLLDQSAGSPPYEIVVVDNNSSDATSRVIAHYAQSTSRRVEYVFEGRQGIAYARNAGIAVARSDLVAFTDDDVRVAPNWVRVIKQTFEAHPEAECLTGRILPVWPSAPPAWLTRLHWVGPLALQDYGDEPMLINATRPLTVAGANFAFRKAVFDRIGLFDTEIARSEDSEFMLRLWRGGSGARYVPEMVLYALVQPERLTKTYHRAWHADVGRCNAHMNFPELISADGSLRSDVPPVRRLMGVPRFAVRQLAQEVFQMFVAAARRREAEAFWHETRARELASYMRESRAVIRHTKWSQPQTLGPSTAVGTELDSPAHSPEVLK
jgi:GT2 family glycosyltransferase